MSISFSLFALASGKLISQFVASLGQGIDVYVLCELTFSLALSYIQTFFPPFLCLYIFGLSPSM